MTDTEAEALGKRLVACRHFRPLRGMLDMQGRTWDTSLLWRWSNAVDVPDMRDPATLGCVLALVREAWNDPGIACVTSSYSNGRYYRRVVDGHHHGSTFQTLSQVTHSTEAEALVAALEVAP